MVRRSLRRQGAAHAGFIFPPPPNPARVFGAFASRVKALGSRECNAVRLPIHPAENKLFDVVGLGLNAMDYLIVVPSYPEFNSKIRLTSYTLSPGGQVATALVGLQRLGYRTAYVGSVGSDDFGARQLETLREAGIDCRAVRVVPGAKSQIAFIIVDQPTGERTIIWDREDALALRGEDLDRNLLTSGRVLHVDGHDIEASTVAAGWARESGIPVVLDIDACRPGTEGLLRNVDYLVSSEQFPERLTQEADHGKALRIIRDTYGCAFCSMTLGRRGALALLGDQFLHVPAFETPLIRDTTGAGDAFHSGFIFGLLRGLGARASLMVGNAVAALSCRQIGARSGLPTLTELQVFLDQQSVGSILRCATS